MDCNFVRGQLTEAELEATIIGLFQEQDYAYVPSDTIQQKQKHKSKAKAEAICWRR